MMQIPYRGLRHSDRLVCTIHVDEEQVVSDRHGRLDQQLRCLLDLREVDVCLGIDEDAFDQLDRIATVGLARRSPERRANRSI